MVNFNAFTTGQRADRKQWFDAKNDSNATLLVDIAGGEGHDIAEFHKRYPDSPGRLNTAAAITPGYSKLLMSKFVLPASNSPLYTALSDVNMMNSIERVNA
ncbi:S-adenosyl-L-methionine-dependent methyltransferase [Xylaria arbuscula]|nr:S-adenosyl-L-methionine-dependent methyltransferase [Xylaria arbuscula]